MSRLAIEPQSQAFIDEGAKQPPPPADASISDLRAGYASTLAKVSVARREDVATRELSIQGAAGPLAARLYEPSGLARPSALLIYIHGGGFAAGDLETHDGLIRMIVHEGQVRALALDYRRPPEHTYPAALDDAHAAFDFVVDHAEELGADPARIALGGESAAGAHCVSLALRLRDRATVVPTLLWLLVPAVDASRSGQSYTEFATGAGRTADEFGFLWSLYLPTETLRTDPAASPLAADLKGLPKTRIYTAEFDPARDDGEAFVAKAKDAGVDARLKRFGGLIHQFPEIVGISDASREAVLEAARDLRRDLG